MEKRTRKLSPENVAYIEARAVVHTFRRDVHNWRSRTVFLSLIAERRGPGQPQYVAEATSRAAEVRAALPLLEAELALCSPLVRGDGQIGDLRMALTGLAREFDDLAERLR